MQVEPIRIPNAASVVASRIRRRIVEGAHPPGHVLPNETELMALYEVSRPVAREALRILENEALIQVKRGPRGGARVTVPDIMVASRYTALVMQWEGTTVADLFEALQILEPAAVRRLATSRPQSAIARLRRRHEQELELLGDAQAYPAVATSFHEDLVVLAGNQTLATLNRLLQHIVQKHNRMVFDTLDPRAGEPTAVAEDAAERSHARVIELIEAGDAERAASLWELHLQEAAALTLRRLGPATVVDLLEQDL